MSPGLPAIYMLQDRGVGEPWGGTAQLAGGHSSHVTAPQGYTYPLMGSRVSYLAPAPGSAPQHEAVGSRGVEHSARGYIQSPHQAAFTHRLPAPGKEGSGSCH